MQQMAELKSSALSYIAQNFSAVASLSPDLAGLADSLLTRLAKVRCFVHSLFALAVCKLRYICAMHIACSAQVCANRLVAASPTNGSIPAQLACLFRLLLACLSSQKGLF